jgi:PAS domain S-box-containing protein
MTQPRTRNRTSAASGHRKEASSVQVDASPGLRELLERSEIALGESEDRFRLMADAAPVMIWMSGPDKLCTYFNRNWLNFTGRPLESEIGEGWTEGVHPDDLRQCLDRYVAAFDARQEFQLEYRLRRADGAFRWVLDTGVCRLGIDGTFEGYIGSCVDITDRKRAEMEAHDLRRELAHVSRVAALGELTASLAHEINQPLTAILSNSQAAQRLLAKAPPDLDEVREILRDIAEDDKRAVEVIRRLRALLKRENLERCRLQPNEVVEKVVQLVTHDAALRQVSLSVHLDPTLPPVIGDRVQLQQVLLNLMLNGLDAVRDVAPQDRKLKVRARKKGASTVEVAVTDSGTGIPNDAFPRIFEPFYTTKPDGLGMGLSISRSIIEAHGGRISAGNNPEGGATFCFTLPVEATS